MIYLSIEVNCQICALLLLEISVFLRKVIPLSRIQNVAVSLNLLKLANRLHYLLVT